jgi:hypothetical protein
VAKQIAATLTSVLDHPQMQVIMDRSRDPLPTANELIEQWNLDLYTRKPGPALNAHGEFQGTDLDLATFMFALANRGAVIQLPTYRTMRAATQREGERVSSKTDRHGQVTGLFSNQEVFSFGVRIQDFNVIQTDKSTGRETVGAPRNFALVDIQGKWHEGWHRIEFLPTAKENDFLTNHKLWTGSTVVVKNFVHPNRWISFYGQPYFITKAMIQRLEEESQFLNKEIKRLKTEGIELPEEEVKEYPKTSKVGGEEKVTVRAFEVEVDLPEPDGEYSNLKPTMESLKAAAERRRNIIYNVLQKLRFAARSVEYAFYLNSLKAKSTKDIEDKVSNDLNANMPSWIKARWEQGYTQKGGRKKWSRLVLFQPAVGELGVSIRFRSWEKTERIAAED